MLRSTARKNARVEAVTLCAASKVKVVALLVKTQRCEVLAVIRDLATLGMPMIMATHQIGFAASLADEFLFMDHGVIVEHGSPADLLAKGSESRTRAFSAKISELTCEMGE